MIAWARLGKRHEAFAAIAELLPEGCRIIETGTVRQIDNWEGDGQSTIVWDTLATNLGGTVTTIEGNTSPDKKGDQRNGGEVCRKIRAYQKKNRGKIKPSLAVAIVGFGKPTYKETE